MSASLVGSEMCIRDSDSSLFIPDPDPEAMLAKLKKVAGIIDATNTEHAMSLNYGVGKTADIASFRGRGSKKLREECYTGAAPIAQVVVKHGQRCLPITH
eukprot:1032175-Alexandrium_andersonii.AAC.1